MHFNLLKPRETYGIIPTLRENILFCLKLKYKHSKRMKPKFENMNSAFRIHVLKRVCVCTLSVLDCISVN
jgi:hypothetical protein